MAYVEIQFPTKSAKNKKCHGCNKDLHDLNYRIIKIERWINNIRSEYMYCCTTCYNLIHLAFEKYELEPVWGILGINSNIIEFSNNIQVCVKDQKDVDGIRKFFAYKYHRNKKT